MRNGANFELDLNQLNQLIKDSGLEQLGTVTMLRALAAELGTEISPARHWSWNYLHQVLHKKLPISGDLRTAIRRLHNRKQGESLELEQVVVLAPPGYVENNSILATQAKLCARIGCKVRFIRNSPNQRYHSLSCRKLARKLRRTTNKE